MEIQASRFPFPTVVKEEGEWVDTVCRTFQWNQRERQKPFPTRERTEEEDSDEEEESEEWDIDDSTLGTSIGGLYGMTPPNESVASSMSGWGTPERKDSASGLVGPMTQLRVGRAK